MAPARPRPLRRHCVEATDSDSELKLKLELTAHFKLLVLVITVAAWVGRSQAAAPSQPGLAALRVMTITARGESLISS